MAFIITFKPESKFQYDLILLPLGILPSKYIINYLQTGVQRSLAEVQMTCMVSNYFYFDAFLGLDWIGLDSMGFDWIGHVSSKQLS